MTDEKTKVETETTETTDEVVEEKTDAETTKESTGETKEALDTTIDYKALAEEERAKRKKAEDVLAGQAFKERKKEREEVVEETTDDDKPLTKAELADVLAKERVETQKQLQANEAKEIVKGYTDDVDEQNYILEIYRGRTLPGTLAEQLSEARFIAHGSKLVGENQELKRALKGKDGVDTNPATTHRKGLPSQAGEPSMPAQDKQLLISQGWKWQTTNKRYEKKTSNGTLLYRAENGSVRPVAK